MKAVVRSMEYRRAAQQPQGASLARKYLLGEQECLSYPLRRYLDYIPGIYRPVLELFAGHAVRAVPRVIRNLQITRESRGREKVLSSLFLHHVLSLRD